MPQKRIKGFADCGADFWHWPPHGFLWVAMDQQPHGFLWVPRGPQPISLFGVYRRWPFWKICPTRWIKAFFLTSLLRFELPPQKIEAGLGCFFINFVAKKWPQAIFLEGSSFKLRGFSCFLNDFSSNLMAFLTNVSFLGFWKVSFFSKDWWLQFFCAGVRSPLFSRKTSEKVV